MRSSVKNVCLVVSNSGLQMEMWDGNEDDGLPAPCSPWKGRGGQRLGQELQKGIIISQAENLKE